MNLVIKGESPEIFTEIPPYRLPHFGTLFKKLWMRIHWFLKEAIPFVLLGVLTVNLLYSLGIIEFLGRIAAPIITKLMGLPFEAVDNRLFKKRPGCWYACAVRTLTKTTYYCKCGSDDVFSMCCNICHSFKRTGNYRYD